MKIELEKNVQDVVNLISEKLGKENIFLVGGFVRDKLRNKESKDIDFAVSLDPETVKRAFPYGYASPFGTVSFKLNGFSITLASRRKENGYQDYRHPGNLIFVNTIGEDFKRRDFTINSLYANTDGEIIDPSRRGLRDIHKHRLVRIGSPKKRLEEDPLRILRAYRFSKERNLKITHRLHHARRKTRGLIINLKKTKIKEEVNKCPAEYQKEMIKLLNLDFAYTKGE